MNQSVNTLRDTPKTAIVRPVCRHTEDLWRDPHGMQTKNERVLSRKFLAEAELNTKSSKKDTKHGLQNLRNYPYHFVFFRVWKKTESQIKNKNNIRMSDQNCLSWPLSFQDQDSSGSRSSDLDDGPCVDCLGNPSVQRKATSTFSSLQCHEDCGVLGTTFMGSSYDSSSSPSVLMYVIPQLGDVGSLFPSTVLVPLDTIP